MAERSAVRAYHSPRREEQSRATRAAILDSARALFTERGYAATTVAAIAERAGVVPDTVYASVGRKPALFRQLVESAVWGGVEPVLPESSEYAGRVRRVSDPRAKLAIYAGAVRAISERMAPLHAVLRAAAGQDPELARMHEEIGTLRSHDTRLFAAHLARIDGVRADLDVDEITDVLWMTNSAEVYVMLVQERGWGPDRYEKWLADSWCRLLLDPPA